MTLELSDYYETLPLSFQKSVSKRSPDLASFIDIMKMH
eukprot:CAMPEP_0170487328 /NCGR_PEP_ID=MMETSP0208-20121228/6175_1 /TAXON_ID=197538 /ORGANISM="Strombidium inclinatum, Strain S3" /LENGTH=37 /DNA_ID= /DNA_START= /DNA_END= /DNA_ORIENTATION=